MVNSFGNAFRLLKKWWRLNRRAWTDFRERRSFRRRDPEYWRGLPERVFHESAPVFFLSTGRCGTALMTEILNRIPGAVCFHAPHPELVYSERKAYEEGLEKFEAYKTAVRAARFELIAEYVVREKVYIETNFRITFFAPHLYDLFPKSRFVHLVRHPGAFVRSAVRRGYYEGGYTDIGRIRPLDGPARDAWPGMSPFERAAWLWNETNLYIERFKESADPERVLTVKAEDLFTDPDAALSIIRHCGLAEPDRNRISKWIVRPVNAQVDGGDLPGYNDWGENMKTQVRRWATAAERYGYEA
jgi:hypothetical protein